MTDRIEGIAGWAERWTAVDRARPEQAGTVAAWLVYAPNQSPAWSHYLVSVVHLRDIPGAAPAKLQRPGMTHEFILVALDSQLWPTVNTPETIHHLRPVNAICQFQVDTDERATEIAELAARAIVDGHMPAEPPFQWQGQRLWQECIDRTAEHARSGGHPSGEQERSW